MSSGTSASTWTSTAPEPSAIVHKISVLANQWENAT